MTDPKKDPPKKIDAVDLLVRMSPPGSLTISELSGLTDYDIAAHPRREDIININDKLRQIAERIDPSSAPHPVERPTDAMLELAARYFLEPARAELNTTTVTDHKVALQKEGVRFLKERPKADMLHDSFSALGLEAMLVASRDVRGSDLKSDIPIVCEAFALSHNNFFGSPYFQREFLLLTSSQIGLMAYVEGWALCFAETKVGLGDWCAAPPPRELVSRVSRFLVSPADGIDRYLIAPDLEDWLRKRLSASAVRFVLLRDLLEARTAIDAVSKSGPKSGPDHAREIRIAGALAALRARPHGRLMRGDLMATAEDLRLSGEGAKRVWSMIPGPPPKKGKPGNAAPPPFSHDEIVQHVKQALSEKW